MALVGYIIEHSVTKQFVCGNVCVSIEPGGTVINFKHVSAANFN